MWGCVNCNIVNKLKLIYLKYILHVNKISTCSNMVYGELGEAPFHIYIKWEMVLYCTRLMTSSENKLSKILYSVIYILSVCHLLHFTWINYVENILDMMDSPGSGRINLYPNHRIISIKLSNDLPFINRILMITPSSAITLYQSEPIVELKLSAIYLHCNDIGDEYDYLLCCPLFKEEHKQYINDKFW